MKAYWLELRLVKGPRSQGLTTFFLSASSFGLKFSILFFEFSFCINFRISVGHRASEFKVISEILNCLKHSLLLSLWTNCPRNYNPLDSASCAQK